MKIHPWAGVGWLDTVWTRRAVEVAYGVKQKAVEEVEQATDAGVETPKKTLG